MSTGRNAMMVSFAAAGLFFLAVIWFAHWPVWPSVVLGLALIVAFVFVVRIPWSNTAQPSLPQEPAVTEIPPPPPVEPRKESIIDVFLPSERQDYYVLFSATVLWLPIRNVIDESAINLAALAVDAVLSRAREITEQRDPGRASMVRHELGRALGVMREDDTGCLQVMAESVDLVLPAHDQQRLDKLAAVRKDEDVWEYERRYEQSKREYLGGDVLKNPGSAVVWWLARNDDQVEKTVQDIGILSQLSHAANNVDVPESSMQLTPRFASPLASDPHQPDFNGSDASHPPGNEKSAADHFDAFLSAINLAGDDPERVLFARRVADLAARHGRLEVAEEIVQRFDTPENAEHSWEANDGD